MATIGGNLPLPGIYKERQLEAEQAYAAALAELSRGQRELFNEYGFSGDVNDQSGQVDFKIDPLKQHGLAFDMLRGHQQSRQRLRQDITGRGLGRRGLAAQRERLMRFLQEGETANLGNRFLQGANKIVQGRGEALRTKNRLFRDAEQAATEYATANGLFGNAGGIPQIDPYNYAGGYVPPNSGPDPNAPGPDDYNDSPAPDAQPQDPYLTDVNPYAQLNRRRRDQSLF